MKPRSARLVPPDPLVEEIALTVTWRRVRVRFVVDVLRGLGWEDRQIRRGVDLMARGTLGLGALAEAVRLSSGTIDETLDALDPSSHPAGEK